MNENNAFTVHHLRFQVQATTPLALDPPPGPKLRAALYQALGMVCPMGGDADAPPEHKVACPVCWLLVTEKPGHERGKDLPRPLAVEPPLGLKREPYLAPTLSTRHSAGWSIGVGRLGGNCGIIWSISDLDVLVTFAVDDYG